MRLRAEDEIKRLQGELAEMAGVSTSVVKGLVKQGVVAEEESPRDLPYPTLDPGQATVALTKEQAAAAEALRERLQNADAELTAMTLALEEQRRKAEAVRFVYDEATDKQTWPVRYGRPSKAKSGSPRTPRRTATSICCAAPRTRIATLPVGRT